jgi:hypothetical protein
MVCLKCGSDNIDMQIINGVRIKSVHHGCL